MCVKQIRDCVALLLMLFAVAVMVLPTPSWAADRLLSWYYNMQNEANPGGVMRIVDLTGIYYDVFDLDYVATQYSNAFVPFYPLKHPFPVTFEWSTLTVDAQGNIIPDPITGYHGNVAIISGNFYPDTWDGVVIPYNEFDEPCVNPTDLVTITNKCKTPRNVIAKRSPNVTYAAIYINTKGSYAPRELNLRRFILMHEMGHLFGLKHVESDCRFYPEVSLSIMVHSSTCNFPHSLQYVDKQALSARY